MKVMSNWQYNSVDFHWFNLCIVVRYEFMYELVTNSNGYVLIDTGGVIWDYAVGLLLVGTVNSEIILFVRIVRRMLSCIYWIFEVLLARKVATTYDLGCCNWYISISIADIDKYLASSGPKWWVRASTPAITRSGIWITVNVYPSIYCAQRHIMGTVPSYSSIYLI